MCGDVLSVDKCKEYRSYIHLPVTDKIVTVAANSSEAFSLEKQFSTRINNLYAANSLGVR